MSTSQVVEAVISELMRRGVLNAPQPLSGGGGLTKNKIQSMIDSALRVALKKLPEPNDACAWDPGFAYWVDKSYDGSNGPSDGSPCRPFLTIQEGIDLAWNEVSILSFDNQAFVFVAGGGSPAQAYDETSLVFYPFVNVIGYGTQDGVRVTSQSPIDLFSFGNYNIANLRFESDWDVPMTSVPFFGFFTWTRFWNCRFDADFTTVGQGANRHWYEFNDCYFSGGGVFDVTNVTWWVADSASYTPLTAHATAAATQPFVGKDGNLYATGVFLYDSFQSGNVDAIQDSGVEGVWVETATRLFGTLTADGANTTAETTGDGYPESGLVLLNGATQYPSGNALGLLYAPAVPGDWAVPPPETVGEALDRLAAANPGA